MLTGIRWFVADRVVLTEFSGPLRIGDYIQAREELQALISPQHIPSFYLIYDTTARTDIDWRLSDIMYVRDLGYKHPRLRSIITVDKKPNPLTSVVGRMAVQFQGLTSHFAQSQDEAAAYLYKIDPTLRAALPR